MTAEELRTKFNNEFGLGKWPKTYEVDAETYASCCQIIFIKKVEAGLDEMPYHATNHYKIIRVSLGPNNGLMFKDVELLLKK